MSSNLVIVAIPAEDDYVWKISSEKVPHMTLLFLGDVEGKPVLKIQEFLEHAVNILEIGPFGMDVDYRGVLGPDEADVLFFQQNWWNFKRIAEFRSQLLKNTAIRTAYESTTQFDGPWLPHLTLGYPTAPAKPLDRDYGLHYVRFDRIALWYGDYEGPEYRLIYKNDLAEVAMSDASDLGKTFLEHHGVKGMHWGVRRSAEARDARWQKKGLGISMRKQHRADVTPKAIRTVLKDVKTPLKKRGKAINAKPEYVAAKKRGDLKKPDLPITQKYEKEHFDAWAAEMKKATDALPHSPSGKLKFDFSHSKSGNWMIGVSAVKHADDALLEIRPVRDEDGLIVDYEEVTSTMNHSAIGQEFLEHHGVKGMRWGIRRHTPSAAPVTVESVVRNPKLAKTKVKAKGGENHPASEDALKAAAHEQKLKKSGAHALSNKELQDLAQRLQLEQQVTQLRSKKPKTLGQKAVDDILADPIKSATTVHDTVKKIQSFR